MTRRDAQVAFGWTLFAPDTALAWDWYGVRWSGRLVAPVTGAVQLGVEETTAIAFGSMIAC